MEMEICNRTVTCNVWRLSASGYNEEGQKLCGSSREKKEDAERREERVEKIGLHRQREEEEKRRMEKTREKEKKDKTSKKRELIKGKFTGCAKNISLGNTFKFFL